MSERLIFGEVDLLIPPHPLLPEGHEFNLEDRPVVTFWGDILPPVSFSHRQLDLVNLIATQPRLGDSEAVTLLARYLSPKLTFNPDLGCWELPLKEDYDDEGKPLYPSVSIGRLGFIKERAHRVSAEVFMGAEIDDQTIDHRCRAHACCNPYHLEAVSIAENNRRKDMAIRNSRQPSLIQSHPLEGLDYGQVLARAAFLQYF